MVKPKEMLSLQL